MRPGELDKLGLGYEELKEINPKIVFMHDLRATA